MQRRTCRRNVHRDVFRNRTLNRRKILALENLIANWKDQIQIAIEYDREPPNNDFYPLPSVEIEFWRNRAENLRGIQQQVDRLFSTPLIDQVELADAFAVDSSLDRDSRSVRLELFPRLSNAVPRRDRSSGRGAKHRTASETLAVHGGDDRQGSKHRVAFALVRSAVSHAGVIVVELHVLHQCESVHWIPSAMDQSCDDQSQPRFHLEKSLVIMLDRSGIYFNRTICSSRLISMNRSNRSM